MVCNTKDATTHRNHRKLEGHSLESIYLRQRCFNGSKPRIAAEVGHKTISKLCVAAVMGAQYLYWDFPDVIKFCVAAYHIRYRRKQSSSGIQTMIRIGLKSWSVCPCPDTCWHATFHPNPCMHFWVILLTDRQTDRRTSRAIAFSSSFVGGKLCHFNVLNTIQYGVRWQGGWVHSYDTIVCI